jgi:hypothetical protein
VLAARCVKPFQQKRDACADGNDWPDQTRINGQHVHVRNEKDCAAIRNIGPVMAQCRVLFRSQLPAQPIATAKQIVTAEDA